MRLTAFRKRLLKYKLRREWEKGLYAMLLKGQWFMISDFSFVLNQIAWGCIIAAVIFSVFGLIWIIVRKPVSRFMKVKEAYVKVLHVPKDQFEGSGIVVRFLNTKRKRRKFFYMKFENIVEGEKGILRYQGAYGLEFKADVQIIQKDYYQKFGFVKKKRENQTVQKQQRVHHKRKYW